MRPIDAIKYGENLVWLIGHGEFPGPQDALRRALYDLAQTSTLTLDDLRPKGRWIAQDETLTKFMCSVCESKNYGGYEKFCPNCGADMRKEGAFCDTGRN